MAYSDTLYMHTTAVLAIVAVVHSQGITFPGSSSNSNSENNESCILPSGATGICKSINDCPVVRQNLANQQPKTCGFQGRIPIVCCPRDPIHIGDNSPPATDFECGTAFQEVIPTVNVPSRSRRFITNGRVSTRNAWPWMALLGQDRGDSRFWFCSGVVLNRRWVLTAAHCTNRLNVTWVRLGEHDHRIDDDGVQVEDVRVADVIYHPGYQPPEAYHDISLIRLARPLKLKRGISPVCLPWGREAEMPLEGNTVTITGWGATKFGDILSPILNEAEVTVFPNEICENSYSKLLDHRFNYPQSFGEESLCIGDNEDQGRDSCGGDSGGPAVLLRGGRYTLVGIVSKGFGCGKNEFPGIYVRVQHHEHLAWIKKVAFQIR